MIRLAAVFAQVVDAIHLQVFENNDTPGIDARVHVQSGGTTTQDIRFEQDVAYLESLTADQDRVS